MPNLFSHGSEYDVGHDSETTGYNVLVLHYDEWWQETKHKLHHWWHEHVSRVSNEQLRFERTAERWALQARRFDELWAILQKPEGERTIPELLTLTMHDFERHMIRTMQRQVFGPGPGNFTGLTGLGAGGTWKAHTVPVQIEGLDGDVG